MTSNDEWYYTIEMLEPDRLMNYKVRVFRNGCNLGSHTTETVWGARRAARRIKRKALRANFEERRTL